MVSASAPQIPRGFRRDAAGSHMADLAADASGPEFALHALRLETVKAGIHTIGLGLVQHLD